MHYLQIVICLGVFRRACVSQIRVEFGEPTTSHDECSLVQTTALYIQPCPDSLVSIFCLASPRTFYPVPAVARNVTLHQSGSAQFGHFLDSTTIFTKHPVLLLLLVLPLTYKNCLRVYNVQRTFSYYKTKQKLKHLMRITTT